MCSETIWEDLAGTVEDFTGFRTPLPDAMEVSADASTERWALRGHLRSHRMRACPFNQTLCNRQQGAFEEHSRNSSHRSGNIRATFREHSGNIRATLQRTCEERLFNRAVPRRDSELRR